MARTALGAIVVALAVALAGCTHTGGAAKLQGQIAAGVTLPAWPSECRWQEAHAALRKGEDIRSILKRERAALDKQNKLTETCARFYDELRARLGGAG